MQGSSRRHRRAFAIATCVMWLLGVEVLPNLHLAAHHGDHTHAADGAIVLSHHHDDDHDHDHDHGHGHGQGHGHRHGAAAHHDDDHADADHDADYDADADHNAGQLALDHVPAARHRAGGISHHATALHRPPPPLLAPVAVERVTWRIEAAIEGQPYSTGTSRPTARGPPAV